MKRKITMDRVFYGKYNGRLITGFEVKFWIDLSMNSFKGYWIPIFGWNFGEPYIMWLWFRLGLKTRYARFRYDNT